MSLECFFKPRSVAVVGASSTPQKLGYVILKNILDGGFPGKIVPVNPKNPEILGLRCSPSVGAIQEPVDLAVVIVPAPFVPAVVAECGQKGIKGAIVISAGFRETGPEGAALEKELLRAARECGIRVIGPNCQGVNSPNDHLCATWPLLTARGKMAIISQSGTIAAAFADWASRDHLGISASVSMGNKLDVNEIDLISYLATDPETRVIALYIEGVMDTQRLRQVLQGCSKPVVVLKSGRTPQGKLAAQSHTSAICGDDSILEGFLKQCRAHRCESFEELYDSAKALAYGLRPKGRRLIIVTTSGGASILTTDAAELLGFDLASIPEEARERVRKVAPPNSSLRNPLDLTGDGAFANILTEVGDLVRDHCDVVVYVLGDPVEGFAEAAQAEDLVIYLGGGEVEREEVRRMHQRGIPVFPTPERGMKALQKLWMYCLQRSGKNAATGDGSL